MLLLNSTAIVTICCELEKHVFPEDIQSDNVSEGIHQRHEGNTRNMALKCVQECPGGRRSKPWPQRVSMHFLSDSTDQKHASYKTPLQSRTFPTQSLL